MLDELFTAGSFYGMADGRKIDTTGQMASRVATEARAKAEAMEYDIEKLLMITEALWSILKEQHGYADEELIRRIQDIDLRDGRLDGKVATEENPACPECGRTLIGKHPVCLYCGTAVMRNPFER